MTAVNLKTLLSKANKNNYAVAGLVVITWEDALAYTEAADETGIPIILQAGPSCRAFTPVSILGKMFRYLADIDNFLDNWAWLIPSFLLLALIFLPI